MLFNAEFFPKFSYKIRLPKLFVLLFNAEFFPRVLLQNLLGEAFRSIFTVIYFLSQTHSPLLLFNTEFFSKFSYKIRSLRGFSFYIYCSARDWDGKDYLRIIPRVVLVEDPRLT